MPRSFSLLAVLGLLISSAAAQTPAPAAKLNSVLDMQEFVQDWKISKQFTLDVAEAMPAEFYSFKPNPDEMTFCEQMAHIAIANVFRFNQITGVQPPFAVDLSKPAAPDKTSVMKMLGHSTM